MTVGTLSTKTLTDIANAVRRQNGSGDLYAPAQLPTAVAALDGSKQGDGRIEPYKEQERGVLSGKVLGGIADAIRRQNGTETRYRPDEMAAAILTLEWGGGLKPRALLLEDGTFELNYLGVKRSTVGGTIVKCWDVDPEGYATPTSIPWHAEGDAIRCAVFDESWRDCGVSNYVRWFDGCTSLRYVKGFENLRGPLKLGYMFSTCTSLETVYASEFDPAIVESCFGMYSGCRLLVGGQGYVPAISEGKKMLTIGPNGSLTDPGNDLREWAWCHLYADGELVIGAEAQGDGRDELASGRICLSTSYRTMGFRPWHDVSEKVVKADLKAGVATERKANISYWFHGCSRLASVDGLGNLAHVHEMDQAFNDCPQLEMLDFRDFDPGELTSLLYTFANCSKLKTIYADPTWALPEGVSGSGTFQGCESLVGGMGTAYSSSSTNNCHWFCLDRGEEDRGYLTAR